MSLAGVRERENGFRLANCPIAIVGLSGIFPEAPDVRTFWSNILNGADCTSEVPAGRWRIEDYYDPDPSAEDKTYCRRGGFIPDVEFDPIEFGLPPNSLEVTDVAQLLSLVVAKEALRDAGYADADDALRERTAVVLGVGGGQKLLTPLTARLQYPVWHRVLRAAGLTQREATALVERIKLAYVPWVEDSFPGMLGNVIAGRVANRLDLGGMNCVVDAACASSFAALKTAVSELVEHRTNLVISGGVDTDNSILMYLCFSKTPAFSRDERIRPFDAAAAGTMIGEGLGMYVLKRLADAERDGDRIYAVIRGIGSSSDGRSKSIYAPLSSGQAVALRRAYQDADCDPATVGLVEAHGTGTAAGDACELTTLHDVFGSAPRHAIGLGSVKSQIGHAKSAAGAAGLIKVALALHHKVLPPTIGVDTPAERLRDPDSPFYLNTTARPWCSPGTPRRGAISSFGFGGTNYHVVLEEYGGEHTGSYRMQALPEAVVVWADTPGELADRCRELVDRLRGPDGTAALAGLVGFPPPPAEAARVGAVVSDPASAATALASAAELIEADPGAEEWLREGIGYRRRAFEPGGRVAVLFPGQGSQYVDMAAAVTATFPELRAALAVADEVAAAAGGTPISEVVYPPPVPGADPRAHAERLRRTEHAQPGIGAVSRGLWAVLSRAGLRADMVAGHSFGELTALWAAGAVDERDIAVLADARGRAMAALPPGAEPGGMLAVHAAEERVRELLTSADVHVANINSPRQVVVAGPSAPLARAREALGAAGIGVSDLPVAAAFHTPLVAHARAPFAVAAGAVRFRPPRIPVYANATAEPYPKQPDGVRERLVEQILLPVRFRQTVDALYRAGARYFVEVGPGGVLGGLVRQTLEGRPALVVSVNPDQRSCPVRQLQTAAMRLRVAGVELGRLDRYAAPPPPAPAKRSPATVLINGANFVSDRTRSRFEQALADGFAIERGPVATEGTAEMTPTPDNPVTVGEAPVAAEPARVELVPAPAPATGVSRPPMPLAVHALPLAAVAAQQQDATRTHARYLRQQLKSARLIADLARAAGNGVPPEAVGTLGRAMEMLHEQQVAVSRNHGVHLDQQHRLLDVLGGQPLAPAPVAPVVPPPADAPRPSPTNVVTDVPAPATAPEAVPETPVAGPAGGDAGAELLAIVADRTGYPVEMLDLGMDIEADLGIDSIKRVEILGALTQVYPRLPAFGQEEISELRTLGQIVDRVARALSSDAAPSAPSALSAPAARAAADLPAASEVPDAGAVLLGIVADRTGYPVEMLDLGMDIEADLGIDSIKRVEILGALTQVYPRLPAFGQEEISELRTLGQIVERVARALSPAAPAVPAPGDTAGEVSGPSALVAGEARLRPLPRPDTLLTPAPAGGVCVLTSDGSPLAEALAGVLRAQGWSDVVRLRLPAGPGGAGPGGAGPAAGETVLDTRDEAISDALLGIERERGPIRGFVHLHPDLPPGPDELFAEHEQTVIRQVFLAAKALDGGLARRNGSGRSVFATVARLDGAFGLAGDRDFSAAAGGLFGLVKTLALEWPAVFCRAVDLHPEVPAELAAELLAAELRDPDRSVAEVGLTADRRVQLVVEDAAESAQPATVGT